MVICPKLDIQTKNRLHRELVVSRGKKTTGSWKEESLQQGTLGDSFHPHAARKVYRIGQNLNEKPQTIKLKEKPQEVLL